MAYADSTGVILRYIDNFSKTHDEAISIYISQKRVKFRPQVYYCTTGNPIF